MEDIEKTAERELDSTVRSAGKKNLIQFIKFALVGLSNTIVDMVVNTIVSFILNLITSGSWIVYAAKTVGYCCGIANSYIWNSRWTFREERRRDTREKLSFIAVNIAVLLISFGLIYLFKNVLHINKAWDALELPEWMHKIFSGDLVCSLIATCVCIPVNFILNKLFVFKGKKPDAEEA